MTNLEELKEVVEKEPWKIVRKFWTCMECPQLKDCIKAQRVNKEDGIFRRSDEEICSDLLNRWLGSESQ